MRRHAASGAWASQLLALTLALSLASGFVEARAEGIVAKPIQTFGANDPKPVTALTSSPDGAKVLTGHFEQTSPDRIEGTARLWDVATGQMLHQFTGHSGELYSLVFSPDETQVATASFDGTARLWNAATGAAVRTFQHTDAVISVAFTQNGTQVLTSSGGAVRFWDTTTGNVTKTYALGVYSFALSPDGKKLLTGNLNWVSLLVDTDSGQVERAWPGVTNVTSSVAFAPDGKRVLIANAGATLYDASTGLKLSSFDQRSISAVAFSPDGKWVLTGGSTGASLWDPLLQQPLGGFVGAAGAAAFLPDATGTRIVIGGFDGIARMYDIRSLLTNLRLTPVGSELELTWDLGGRLQEATDPAGPWSEITGAKSPYQVDASRGGEKFYRILIFP
jgi:YD repeat-containing protein